MSKRIIFLITIIVTSLILVACKNTNTDDMISIVSEPNHQVFEVGDDLDLTGLKIKTEINGNVVEISYPNDDLKISGYDKTKIGTQTITVAYLTLEVTIQIEVREKTVEKPVVDIPDDAKKLSLQAGLIRFNSAKLDHAVNSGFEVSSDIEISIGGQYFKLKGDMATQSPKEAEYEFVFNADYEIANQVFKGTMGRKQGLMYADVSIGAGLEKQTYKQVEKVKNNGLDLLEITGFNFDIEDIENFDLKEFIDFTDLTTLKHVEFYEKGDLTYGVLKINQEQVLSFIKPIYETYFSDFMEEEQLIDTLSEFYTTLDLELIVTLKNQSLYSVSLEIDSKNNNVTNHAYFSFAFNNPKIAHPDTSAFEQVYQIGDDKYVVAYVLIPIEKDYYHISIISEYDQEIGEKNLVSYDDIQDSLRFNQVKEGYSITNTYLDEAKTNPFTKDSNPIEVSKGEVIYLYVDIEPHSDYITLNIIQGPNEVNFGINEPVDLTGLVVELVKPSGLRTNFTYEQMKNDMRFKFYHAHDDIIIIFIENENSIEERVGLNITHL